MSSAVHPTDTTKEGIMSQSMVAGEKLWTSTLQANSARLHMLREVDSDTLQRIEDDEDNDGGSKVFSQPLKPIKSSTGNSTSKSFSRDSTAKKRTPRKSGNVSKRSFIMQSKLTSLNKPFTPSSEELRPTGLHVGLRSGTMSSDVPVVERIFDLDKYDTSLHIEAYLDRKQLKQAESVMIDLVHVLKSGWFSSALGQEPIAVINQMLTLTSILGNSCNAVGSRMGEVILMNVFSNVKEWVDRTVEESKNEQKLREAKLKKQAEIRQRRGTRATRRVMRLSSFVAARKVKVESEEILRLRNWLQTADHSVECLLMGQNDAMDGFQDAVSYLGEHAMSAMGDIIQGTIMRSIIHFDFELASLHSIIVSADEVKGNFLTIFFSVVAILLSFMEVGSQLGLFGAGGG